jgi:hypothetical protein
MIKIEHNVNRVTAKLDRIPAQLDDELSHLVRDVLGYLNSQTKFNVTNQGGTFGQRWEAKSKWISAKKGAGAKTLAGMENYIRHNMTSKLSGRVAFYSPGDWTLTQHHRGFTLPASGREETISIRNPSALGLTPGTKAYKFVWRKDSKVPARQIWPTEKQAFDMAGRQLIGWLAIVNSKLVRMP